MRKLSLLLILFLVTGLTGCFPHTRTITLGNEKLDNLTSEEVNQRVVLWKTTKEEILEWFGSPLEIAVRSENGKVRWFLSPPETVVRSDSGRLTEVWEYVFDKTTYFYHDSLSSHDESKTIYNKKWFKIHFENDEIVSGFIFSDRNERGRQPRR
ncbi:MAG: hypothetical protein FWD51_00580 [Betaproteobacteria bacterium]|nr:hypothetical protein [Betaproteobacteria bacterium]